MNIYNLKENTPWNNVMADKMLINADTMCTLGATGHAVSARKVNLSCANEMLRGKWILIDSQSNSQYVINLAERFPACLIAVFNTLNWVAKTEAKIRIDAKMCIQCGDAVATLRCGNNCINGLYCTERCARRHYTKHVK